MKLQALEEGSDIAALAIENVAGNSEIVGQSGKDIVQATQRTKQISNTSIHGLIQQSECFELNIKSILSWAASKSWVQKYTDGGVEMWGTIKGNDVFSWRVKIKPEPSIRHELGAGSRVPRFDARIDEGTCYNPFTGENGGKLIGTHIPLKL